MPQITILMANYNKGEFIEEAVRSVQAQTFRDWELLVIDDGSTDGSCERLAAYMADARIKLHRMGVNGGYTKALICGLGKITSPIVGILDSDDALASTAIEKICTAFYANNELGLVLTQMFVCDSSLRTLFISATSNTHSVQPLLWMRGPTAFRSFRMSAYQRTSGFDTRMASGEDHDLIVKLEEVSEVSRIEEPLYYYRQLGDSQSKSPRSYLITYVCICESLYRAYRRREKRNFNNLPCSVLLSWLISGVRYSIRLEAYGRAIWFIIKAIRVAPFEPAVYRTVARLTRSICARINPKMRASGDAAWGNSHWFFPTREFQSNTGNRDPDRIVCIPLEHREGHCLFGGDISIFTSGYYCAYFELDVGAFSFSADPLLTLDVYENLFECKTLAERRLSKTELSSGPKDYGVAFSAREGYRVEFRVFWAEQCSLSVTGITLSKLSTDPEGRSLLV